MDASVRAYTKEEAPAALDLTLPPPPADDQLTLPKNRTEAARAGLMLSDTITLGLASVVAQGSLVLAGNATGLALLPLLAPIILLNTWLGLYPGFGLPRPERLRRQWLGALAYFAILAVITLALVPAVFWQVAHVAATAAAYLALAPLMSDLSRRGLQAAGQWGKPVLLLGPPRSHAAITDQLAACWWLGLLPVSYRGGGIPDGIDTVIMPSTSIVPAEFAHIPNILCINDPADVEFAGHTRLAARPHPRQGLNRAIKRTLDLMVGGTALLLASPVIILFCVAVVVMDRGSPFYFQKRPGLNGRLIKVWKIRSMYQNSDQLLHKMLAENPAMKREWETVFKLRNDPRILPLVGRFIRKYSIDELPQLWNVVKGDLSLVGPRVFVDFELGIYTAEQLAARQSVMPGLTGLWQVSARSSGSNADKVRYDMAYVRNWSLWLDLDILYRTVGVVVSAKGSF